MVKVEVLIDALKDKKVFYHELKVTRKGKEIVLIQKLLMKGDQFETDKDHAKYLADKGLVKIIENEKKTESTSKETK